MKARKSGFTLVEILIVVIILGILAAIVIPQFTNASQDARNSSLLSQLQTLRFVVIPQAIRRILPPLLNDFVALQKDTALVSVVGLAEILNIANILKNNHFNLSPVTGAALFFLIITIPCTRFVDYLIKRDRARMQAG